MKHFVGSVLSLAVVGISVAACGGERANEDASDLADPSSESAGAEGDDEANGVGTSESALGEGCLPCSSPAGCLEPGTCLRRSRVGRCTGGNRLVSQSSTGVDPVSYAYTEYTPWVGGGDSQFCSRRQIQKSWSTVSTYRNCMNGELFDTTYGGTRVQRSRGISASRFGNTGVCGLWLTYGPWSSWSRY